MILKVVGTRRVQSLTQMTYSLLQRSNMSIEKGVPIECTPAECYILKNRQAHNSIPAYKKV